MAADSRETAELRLVAWPEHDLPPAERAACDELWERTWPTPPGEPPDPDFRPDRFLRLLLLDPAGQLVAAAALIERTIDVNGTPCVIAGVQGVVVEEAQRGRGHGARVVRAAVAEARQRGYAFAMLFCDPWNQSFYERLGWHALGGEIVQQRQGRDELVPPERDVVMAQPLTEDASAALPAWQSARIHVGVGQW